MADEYNLGTLVGKITFYLPESEKKKLKTEEYQKLIGKGSVGIPLPSSGASGGSNATQQKDEGKNNALGMEKSPIGKGLLGLGKLMGPLGAVLSFIGASGGLRALLGAFFDLIGLISDLIFIAIFPILKPLLNGIVNAVKVLVNASKEEGGILGALLKPEVWMKVVGYLLEGLLLSASELLNLAATLINGMASGLKEGTPFDTEMKDLIGRLKTAFGKLFESVFAVGEAVWDLFKTNIQLIFDGMTWTKVIDNMLTAIKAAANLLKDIGAIVAEGIWGWFKDGGSELFADVGKVIGNAALGLMGPLGYGLQAAARGNLGGSDGKWYTPW